MDTSYVLPRAVALVVLRPAQLFKAPMAEWLPTEVATAAGLKYLGFDPAEVDEVVAFCGMPSVGMEYGVMLKFAQPFKGSSIPEATRAHAQPGEIAGRKYLKSSQPMLPSFYAQTPTRWSSPRMKRSSNSWKVRRRRNARRARCSIASPKSPAATISTSRSMSKRSAR